MIRLWTVSLALLKGSVVLAGRLVDGHSVRDGISGYYTAGKRVRSVPPFLGPGSNSPLNDKCCILDDGKTRLPFG